MIADGGLQAALQPFCGKGLTYYSLRINNK